MAQSVGRREGARASAPSAQATSRRRRLGERERAIGFGVLAAIVLIALIAIGSRGFHWFDAALIGYAVASIFAVAAITYKYTFWLMRPQTGRYSGAAGGCSSRSSTFGGIRR